MGGEGIKNDVRTKQKYQYRGRKPKKKPKKLELKSITTEMKNSLEELKARFDKAKTINKLENRTTEIIKSEEKKEKKIEEK